MSPVAQRRLLTWIVPIVVTAGGISAFARWAYQKSVVEPLAEKLDASRFVADSIYNVVARARAEDRASLRDSIINAKMDEALLRLRQMKCRPTDPACR